MFTLDQIKAAHSKVKSGADFPLYIRDLIKLGVLSYENPVSNGNTQYHGKDGFVIESGAKYSTLEISELSNKIQFEQDLKIHQQGKTNYPTFCNDCAKSGVVKWIVDLTNMTCIYYDKKGNEVLMEKIPTV